MYRGGNWRGEWTAHWERRGERERAVETLGSCSSSTAAATATGKVGGSTRQPLGKQSGRPPRPEPPSHYAAPFVVIGRSAWVAAGSARSSPQSADRRSSPVCRTSFDGRSSYVWWSPCMTVIVCLKPLSQRWSPFTNDIQSETVRRAYSAHGSVVILWCLHFCHPRHLPYSAVLSHLTTSVASNINPNLLYYNIRRGKWGKADYLRNSMQYFFTGCLYLA